MHADFQTIEGAMTEGHPCFVANNGRVGFDAVDVAAYAPETGPRLRLQWLAVHRELRHNARIRAVRDFLAREVPAALQPGTPVRPD